MNPIETVKGKIIGINEREGTVCITAPVANMENYIKRGYREVYIEFIDARPLSKKQRSMCWALIGEISGWMGDDREATNEFLKLNFIASELASNMLEVFSLSNASMSVVAAYQKYLIDFILRHDIPVERPLYEYTDDMQGYVYACMKNKKCVVCGRPAGLHHLDRVGMGRNRDEIIHEGMEAISLCWPTHHMEAETIGDTAFLEKYHFDGGVILDKAMCKLYGLKTAKGSKRK